MTHSRLGKQIEIWGVFKMYHWHQNLNEKKNQLFHFRGSFAKDWDHWAQFKYEVSSGRNFRFDFTIKPYKSLSLSLGLFFITIYLTVPFFSFARWIKDKKETGFYFHHWAFVAYFMRNEWSLDSLCYFHIDEFFLGKTEVLKDDITSVENIGFQLGEKKFNMDSVKWLRNRAFRTYVPYVFYHKTWISVEMKINKPPLHSGKGENSWDCGDDGSYGLYSSWEFEKPTWRNKDEMAKKAVEYYVEQSVMKDCKRYGGSSNPEFGVNAKSEFKYLGVYKPVHRSETYRLET